MSKAETLIAVRDIGPVIEFEYKMTGPGLHVLRGKQGAGKTTVLRTVQLATDGRTDIKPTKRDATRRGEATVAGKVLTIAKRIQEEGAITVDGLGDLDIAALHSPKFKTAVIRDRHRINVLLRLIGVAADASRFHDVVGGADAFREIVSTHDLETDDLVEMAARIKRAVERRAQEHERVKDSRLADARAAVQLVEGVDLAAPHDESALSVELGAAGEHRAALQQRNRDAAEVVAAAGKAQAELDALGRGPDLAELEGAVSTCSGDAADWEARVQECKDALAEAESCLLSAEASHGRAADAFLSAFRQAETLAKWEATIKAGADVQMPTGAELVKAHDRCETAQGAVMYGVKVREALAAQKRAAVSSDEAKEAGQRAARLREAARAAGRDVLADAVASVPDCPLFIVPNPDGDPRLVIATDRSSEEPFEDLSDGERWPVILGIAASRNRLIVLPQAAYGELSPETRRQLHELAVEREVYLLTAEADDGDLRGEAYDQGPPQGLLQI